MLQTSMNVIIPTVHLPVSVQTLPDRMSVNVYLATVGMDSHAQVQQIMHAVHMCVSAISTSTLSINQSIKVYFMHKAHMTHTHNRVDRQNRETNTYRQKHKNYCDRLLCSVLFWLRRPPDTIMFDVSVLAAHTLYCKRSG